MWMWFIPAILAAVYCLKYWNLSYPPPGDVISPLVMLTFAIEVAVAYPITPFVILIIIGLFFDALADSQVNKESMSTSICLFSIGHVLRQMACNGSDFNEIVYVTFGVMVFLIIQLLVETRVAFLIISYSCIMLFTFLNVSWTIGSFINGFLLFIISDLIIAWELMVTDVPHRPFRIIAVPLLFWAAEYILIRQLLG